MNTTDQNLTKITPVPIAILFCSGISALIYQTLWVKQLALVVGVDVYAVTTGVSAFFAGLAIGSVVMGRWADRMEQPLYLYGLLELGVAITGLGTTYLLFQVAELFVRLQDRVGILAWLLPFLLVGIPAILMGGTFVVLLRGIQPLASTLGKTAGTLYAANTAGAILGTLITPFLLIPNLGIQGSGRVAAAVNLLLAVTALGWSEIQSRESSQEMSAIPSRSPNRTQRPPHASLALTLYTLAGGIALGYEVIWTQSIVQFLSTRAYAFGVVLATYLLGLALGSWGYARWADRMRRPWRMFGILIAAAGMSGFAIMASIDIWLPRIQYYLIRFALKTFHSQMIARLVSFEFAAGIFVLLPTLFLGAAFPLAIRLAVGTEQLGRDAGRVAAFNTAGGIAGTCLTGFVLIPHLGLIRSFGVLATTAVLLGAIAVVRDLNLQDLSLQDLNSQNSEPEPQTSQSAWQSIGFASLLVIGFALSTSLVSSDKLGRILTAQHHGPLVFYQEELGGTVAVLEQAAAENQFFRRLYIQGVSNTGDAMPSLRYMRLQALLPLTIHNGEPRSTLVIGLGSGITAGSLLTSPTVENVTVAELMPGVVEAAREFTGNFNVTDDPRVDIKIADGRHELLRTQDPLDLITLEPPPPSAAGVVNLYYQEFYKQCRGKLAANGLLAQWWPIATQNDEDSRSLVQSFLTVFPYASVWTTELHEMLLVGSMQPIELNASEITTRYQQPQVQAALTEIGIDSPAALLATYVTDQEGLKHYAGNAASVTDDRPRIEYADWPRPNELVRVLPRVIGLYREPEIGTEDETFLTQVAAERQQLWTFYRAELAAYSNERMEWIRLASQVMQADPENPYYLWLLEQSS
ncbi:MAG: fused MFS/spermidine synthase [Microcoleaceae cyanobacterium]